MPSTAIPKELRKIAKTARAAGWAIFLNGTGHVVFRGPNGKSATLANTGHRSGRAMLNERGHLRRAGVPGA